MENEKKSYGDKAEICPTSKVKSYISRTEVIVDSKSILLIELKHSLKIEIQTSYKSSREVVYL